MGFFKRNKTKPAQLNEEFNPWAFERENTPIETIKVPVIKLVTDRSATFYAPDAEGNNQPYTVDSTNPAFVAVTAELALENPDLDYLVRLVDSTKAIKQAIKATPFGQNYLTKGVFNVTRAGVTFNDEPIHNALADRLMAILNAGLRLGPWIRFAENLYQNPAEYARDELGEWLEKADLPITDDGHFLAYKVVTADFKDCHSRTFDNSPGKIVQLAGRHEVDPIRTNLCSRGLHFCSKSYLPGFRYLSEDRKVVLVKINPADVVSIPAEYNRDKGRCWRYEVLEEVKAETIMDKAWGPVATNFTDDWDSPEDEYVDEVDEDAAYDPLVDERDLGVPATGRLSERSPGEQKLPKPRKSKKGKALSAKKADDMSIKELRKWLRENRPTKGARIMTRAELVKAATS